MSDFILHQKYFDPESSRISSYFSRLFILIGQESLQYCILDTEKNTFIALADYRLPASPKTPEIFHSQLRKFISGEDMLLKKYPSVVIGIDTSWHTLVPAPLFDISQMSKYLEFNFGLPDGCLVRSDQVPEIVAHNVYGIMPGLIDMIQGSFAVAALVHRSTALISSIYHQHKISSRPASGFLNYRGRFIDLIFFEENRPVFINSFPCRSKEDILYFTLYAIEQLNLRPDSLDLYISGMMDAGSEAYLLLGQYVRTISFSSRLSSFSYSPLMNQAPSQFYNELFALALCGS